MRCRMRCLTVDEVDVSVMENEMSHCGQEHVACLVDLYHRSVIDCFLNHSAV